MPHRSLGERTAQLRRWVSITLLVLLTSIGTVHALEYSLTSAFGWDFAEHLERLPEHTMALNTAVVSIIVLGLFALTGRLRVAIPITTMLAAFLAVVNHLKIQYRGEPLYPSDFAYAGEAELLVSSVGLTPALVLVGVLLGVGLLTWLTVLGLGWLLRIPPAPRKDRRRAVITARILATALATLVIVNAAGFSAQGNTLRRAFDDVGADWIPWSQNENYLRNGFLAGFLYNMPAAPMQEPDGYGRQAIASLVDQYADLAREVNEYRDPHELDHTNVVIILGESFYDPTMLDGLVVAEDPLTFTHQLMTETMAGHMRTVAFGGGTANVEFEVLTGMATANFSHTLPPYQGIVAHADTFPSVLGRFDDTHTTIGIHPFLADFYRRSDTYRAFGFDLAKFHDDMVHTWRVASEGGYASDAAAFEELLDELREHEGPVFANVVTMQNHAGYAGLYPDPIPALEPPSATESWGLSDYLRGLAHADEAIASLLSDLTDLGERTVVLYYGDHAPPGVIPEDVWDRQAGEEMYTTPWFVWSTDGVHPTEHQGLISPTQLWNQTLRAMDAPISPWDALLLRLEADPEDEELLHDYLMLQYDASVGARYGTDALFRVP